MRSRLEVRQEQLWRSSDARHHGRLVRVVEVDDGVAVIENCQTGRRTTVATRRLCGQYHWRLIGYERQPDRKESGEDQS